VGDARTGNRKHVFRLWSLALLGMGVLLLTLVFAATRGSGSGPFLLGGGVFVGSLAFAALMALRARRRFAQLLREPTPDPMLAYTRTMLGRTLTPHIDLVLAASLATQRAIWGQFEQARYELHGHDWISTPPMYRAMMLHALALVHYLSRDDVAAGLRAAREAAALGELPRAVPGAASARASHQLYIEIGQVLCEGGSEQLAASLDRTAHDVKRPVEHAISLWGRALARASLGQEGRAAELRAQLAELAPHCAPLQNTDPNSAPTANELAPSSSWELRPETRDDSSPCPRCARPVSELASLCSECVTQLHELRQRNLVHEGRLRAVGLCIQIGAMSFGALVALSTLTILFSARFHVSMLVAPVLFIGVATLLWRVGRSIRGFHANWQRNLRLAAFAFATYVPIGSLVAAGIFWQLRRPPFDAHNLSDYQQALRISPELEAPSQWPLALALYAALCCNLGLWIWFIAAS
jgi:hypothetical protein